MRYSKLFLCAGLTLATLPCWGRAYTFDSTMLDTNSGESIDVSLFNQGLQLPGNYLLMFCKWSKGRLWKYRLPSRKT